MHGCSKQRAARVTASMRLRSTTVGFDDGPKTSVSPQSTVKDSSEATSRLRTRRHDATIQLPAAFGLTGAGPAGWPPPPPPPHATNIPATASTALHGWRHWTLLECFISLSEPSDATLGRPVRQDRGHDAARRGSCGTTLALRGRGWCGRRRVRRGIRYCSRSV